MESFLSEIHNLCDLSLVFPRFHLIDRSLLIALYEKSIDSMSKDNAIGKEMK